MMMNLKSFNQKINDLQRGFKNITVVSLCLLCSGYLSAQCGSGLEVTLSTQTQVNNFITTYCTNFLGSIRIQDDNDGVNNITTLAPLSSLTYVGGDLLIVFNDALTNVNGLAALTSVDGDLLIEFNNALTNLDGLSVISSVGGFLHIKSNDALTNVNGLAALSSVGFLQITSNDALANVNGLAALSSVGGFLRIALNDALTNVNGLSALTSVGEDLFIDANAALTNVNGLSALTSVGGDLLIEFNNALINVDGLSAFTSVGGFLQISSNDALTNVNGLSSLSSVGSFLVIRSNDALTNINGLAALTSVGGFLRILSNPTLSQCCGLYSIIDAEINGGGTAIGGTITLSGNLMGCNSTMEILNGVACCGIGLEVTLSTQTQVNNFINTYCSNFLGSIRIEDDNNGIDNITTLAPLMALTSVGENLFIFGNATLTNVNGLSALTSVGGSLQILSNTTLTNVDGLSALTSVGGDLIIFGNATLTNVDGLSALTSVGSILEISFNNVLTNVDGLSALTSVGGFLSIQFNTALTNVDGLSALTSVGGDLNVDSNPTLSQCCGLYIIIDAEINGGGTAIGGTITFSGNLMGCNSTMEILDGGACGSFVNTNTNINYITLQDAIDAADPMGLDTIALLDHASEADVTVNNSVCIKANGFILTIPSGFLTIPIGKSLVWKENNLMINAGAAIINNGTLWNHASITHINNFINSGLYKGRGTFIGSFNNNGQVSPGN